MLIERILKDGPHGTRITLWGKRYFFEPVEEGGAHVAEVTDPAHIQRLLSITEGFRVWTTTTGEVAEDADEPLPLEAMTETDLRDLYQHELGRAPHWNARMETLIEHIKAHRESAADQE